MQKILTVSLVGLKFLALVAVSPLVTPVYGAGSTTVTTEAELDNAIIHYNGLADGSDYTINIANDIVLSDFLTIISSDDDPNVSGTLTVQGVGDVSLSGNSAYRHFFLNRGNLSIQNLTLMNGVAQGGDGGNGASSAGELGGGGGGLGAGGSVFVNRFGNLTVDGVTFSSNQAVGGNGGNLVSNNTNGGGGGGGFGGNGGNGFTDNFVVTAGSGGGGGFSVRGNAANGADGETEAGGSGGGPGGGTGGADLGDNGSNGTFGGGGGGGGGSSLDIGDTVGGGGDGGEFAGGGAGLEGGSGGFGGGSGSGSEAGDPADQGVGGFGGGAGSFANPGFGGGATNSSGVTPGGGGGGAGYGGAIFVRDGGTVTVSNTEFDGNTFLGGFGGSGASAGEGAGEALYLMGDAALTYNVATGDSETLDETIFTDLGNSTAPSGGISKEGEGSLRLSNGGSTATVDVRNGTLLVSNSIFGASSTTTDVQANATLHLEHELRGTVSVHDQGRLLLSGDGKAGDIDARVGASVSGAGSADSVSFEEGGTNFLKVGGDELAGTLEFGSLKLASGTVLEYEFFAPAAADALEDGLVGTDANDLIRVENELVLNGILMIQATATIQVGLYTLIEYGTLSPTSENLTLGVLPAGVEAELVDPQTTPGSIQLNVTAVPEPGALSLSAAAVAAWLLRRRRLTRHVALGKRHLGDL